MHYYKRNIGEYYCRYGGFTIAQHGAFSIIADSYHGLEKAPSWEDIVNLLSPKTESEIQDIKLVLSKAFRLEDGVYLNDEIERQIEDFHKAKAGHWGGSLTKPQRNSIAAARNAAKKSASPPWTTREQKAEMLAVYELASTLSESTGIKHEVDHIVPLKNDFVCGLHVPWNLRAIPYYENREKNNKFIPGSNP